MSPLGRFPVTHTLALLCSVVFLLALVPGWQQAMVVAGGFIPARFGHDGGIVAAGWLVPAWLTPLSAAFLHGDIFHLAFNMLMLVFIGRQLELPLGARGVIVLFLVGAYAAALAEALLGSDPMLVMIGASGAVSAMVGCYALIFNNQQVQAIGPIPAQVVRALWLGAAWVGLQLLIGYAAGGGIAVYAHIGGFVAGLLLARPLLKWRFRS